VRPHWDADEQEEAEEEQEEQEEREEQEEPAGDPAMLRQFLKTRTVLLTGEINKTLAERVVRQVLLLEQGGDEPIKVFIDSPGGDADAGFAILDMMRFVRPQIKMIGMGLVASAGAIVLLAAPREQRFALPNSRYLIHQPMAGFRGVGTEIEIHAKEIDLMRRKMNELISQETDKPVSEVEQDTDRDYWMGAEEALTYGLVGKIIRTQDEL
jgi:ATP-dependent Clp protease protease subunit